MGELDELLKNLTIKQTLFYLIRLRILGFREDDYDAVVKFASGDDYLLLLNYYNEVLNKLESMTMYKEISHLKENYFIYTGFFMYDLWFDLMRCETLYDMEVKRRKPWEEFAKTLKYEEQNGQVVITI